MNLVEQFHDDASARSFKQAEVIIHEADRGHLMYVVLEGHVEIIARGQLLDVIGPGGFFGEMSLIDHSPRMASVIARTDCRLIPLAEGQFLDLIKSEPGFAIEVMKMLTRRLRREMQIHAPA